MPDRDHGVELAAVTVPGGIGAHKWADRRLLAAAEADAAPRVPLLVDDDGAVLEASRGNLFVVLDGALVTPPADGRILPGVTRRRVLLLAAALDIPVREEAVPFDRLASAEGMFLTGAVRGVEPVRTCDGEAVAADEAFTPLLARELRRSWARDSAVDLAPGVAPDGERTTAHRPRRGGTAMPEPDEVDFPGVDTLTAEESAELQMLIVMNRRAAPNEVEEVLARLDVVGARGRVAPGRESTVIGAIGDREELASLALEGFAGVQQVLPIHRPYKWVSRETSPEPTQIQVRGRRIGGDHFGFIAGPCTVESREQTLETAKAVHEAGASMLRGGAFKPRTSPYSFKGLGTQALEILAEAREETGLPLVTELMDPRHVEAVIGTTDVVQIGARNMQNFFLLAEVGRGDKPVLLKRGPSASVEELLMAAEYILKEGNPRVILCERGIRTFERSTRYTLDIGAIPVLKEETHLPVIVDPSHAAGRRELVPALARAAVAAGADGIIVEVHPAPEQALCDAPQLLAVSDFGSFARDIVSFVSLMGKVVG
jgi:3-deoxy-7-phosphoheptulonate synthase